MDFLKHQTPLDLPAGASTLLSPTIIDLKASIESNPELFKLSLDMFTQTAVTSKGNLHTLAIPQQRRQITPACSSTPRTTGLTCPITDALDPFVSTPAGNNLFTHKAV
ncbi:hypothetical protein BDV12DRAFT_199099 [Aspergillus spectabilis]